MGTLLAFTMVAVSVLILRYIPPAEVPLPPFEDSIDSVSSRNRWISDETNEKYVDSNVGVSEDTQPLVIKEDVSTDYPLISQHLAIGNCESCLSF